MPLDRIVGDPIGIGAAWSAPGHAQRSLVDGDDFVRARGTGEYGSFFGNSQNAVRFADVRDRGNDAICIGVKNDDGAVTEMCDEQQMPPRIEGLIIEPGRGPRKPYVGNWR